MFKNILTKILLFFFVITLNISIVNHIYTNSIKDKQITIILQEFKNLSGADFKDENIDFFIGESDKDRRVAVLKAFFRKYDSPLYDYADFIVKISDENELDYRLIPAISMQESTACKFIPQNSHNCWGWGIYGNKITRFDSYPHAIETVAKGLKKNYIDKGLTTPESIMAKYTPSSNGSWANGVSSVLGVLE